jgi:hypothetical protein
MASSEPVQPPLAPRQLSLTWRTADVLIASAGSSRGARRCRHDSPRGSRMGTVSAPCGWSHRSQRVFAPRHPPSHQQAAESEDAGAAERQAAQSSREEGGGQDHAANTPAGRPIPGRNPRASRSASTSPRLATPEGALLGRFRLAPPRARSQLPTKVTASTRQRQHHSGRRRRKMDVYAHTRAR